MPNGCTGHSLGIVNNRLHIVLRHFNTVVTNQFRELIFGNSAGGKLRPEVPEDLHRKPYISFNEAPQRLVTLPPRIELRGRDTETFLVNFGGVGGVGTRHPATHVHVVTDRRRERQALLIIIYGLKDKYIRQVHTAGIRIVHNEQVARMDVTIEVFQNRLQSGRHRTKV